MWNYLLILGRVALKEVATKTLIPSSLKAIQSTIKATKSLTTKKSKQTIINKGISAITHLSPTPVRSALNYTLKSKYYGIDKLDNDHIKHLIKMDIKKSLYNNLVPNEIKSIISIFKKADQYIDRKLKEALRLQKQFYKEEEKRIARERRETLRRLREIRDELRRYLIDQRKIERYIIQKRRELFNKIQKQLKEEIRIQKRVNKQIKEDIERRYKQFDKNVRLFHKHLANVAYEENNKGSYTDFFDFVDTLSPIEQNNLQVLLHKYTTVRISFNSKWIKAAMWEPLINIREYKDQVGLMTKMSKGGTKKVFSNSAKGILKIIVRWKFRPRTNPKGLYAWYNVSFGTWKKIIAIKNGTNFWKVFYHKARINRRYITNESIYYKYDRSLQYKHNKKYKRSPRQEDYTTY